ncbi:hypothetical protein FOA52_012489 [Chlamydomonas sp. UWO 241]|nr:hypothetical protein FOA52_012489 [Chlamydomonas sp. UWO 241]
MAAMRCWVRAKLSRERTLSKIARELDMLTRLQPARGVIRLLECFEDDDSVQIVTELCPGGDLHKYVESHGPLDEFHLAMVAYEVLQILTGLHERGVIHGDVKPANFCLKVGSRRGFFSGQSDGDQLKAIDFGCSQLIPASGRMSKRTGTPVFMAPEIFRRDYCHKADVWSVGVMLYWLYCRRFPCFASSEMVKQARLEEVAEAVTHAPITYDGPPWSRMSPSGLAFIRACLCRDEAQRWSATDALSDPWLAEVAAREAAVVAKGAALAAGGGKGGGAQRSASASGSDGMPAAAA